jgi:hypothetical protein
VSLQGQLGLVTIGFSLWDKIEIHCFLKKENGCKAMSAGKKVHRYHSDKLS